MPTEPAAVQRLNLDAAPLADNGAPSVTCSRSVIPGGTTTPTFSPVFAASAFGGNGNATDGTLTDGPFATWAPLYPTQHLLARGWVPGPTTIDPFIDEEPIQTLVVTATSSFALTQGLQLEHGLVHNNIGGDMKTMDSPNDPLFWMLHAYLDKVWADWQASSPANASSYTGTNADGTTASLSDQLPGLGMTVSDVMSIGALCYRYVAPNNSGPSPGQLPPTQPQPTSTTTTTTATTHTTSTTTSTTTTSTTATATTKTPAASIGAFR